MCMARCARLASILSTVDNDENAFDEIYQARRLFPTFPHVFHLLFVKHLIISQVYKPCCL